jgi:hypothetical protein
VTIEHSAAPTSRAAALTEVFEEQPLERDALRLVLVVEGRNAQHPART